MPNTPLPLHSGVQPEHTRSPAAGRAPRAKSRSERRREARIPFSADLVVQWLEPALCLAQFEVVDLSLGGIRLKSSHLMAVGRLAQAMLVLPEQTRIGRIIEVVWSRPMDDGSYHTGCRFMG